MNATSSRRRVLRGAGVAVLSALAGCSGLTPFVGKRLESERTIPIEGASSLAVVVDAGDVTVRGERREDVHVDLVKKSSSVNADLSKLEFRVEREDDRVVLRGEWTGDDGLSGKPSMDVTVTAPSTLGVARAEARVGDVAVEHVTVDQENVEDESVGDGVLVAESGTGDVSVRDVAGDVRASTGTGDVTLRDVDGGVEASAATGDVTVRAVTGSVQASASTGDVLARDVGSVASASAQTGDVTVDVPAISGATTVEASTGDVTASIGPIDAELDAHAGVGDVTVDDVELGDATVSESAVRGTLGAGGPTLTLESQVGDVVVDALD